jgi:hypothetical protein
MHRLRSLRVLLSGLQVHPWIAPQNAGFGKDPQKILAFAGAPIYFVSGFGDGFEDW